MVEKVAIVLTLSIIQGCNLAAKDRSGTSDPFVVARLDDQKKRTDVVRRNLNPSWDAEFSFSVKTSSFPISLQLICYDKDRIRKNYIGEASLSTKNLVSGGLPKLWENSQNETLQLVDLKSKKNKVENPGTIVVKYGFSATGDDASLFAAFKPIWDAFAAQSLPVYRNLYRDAGIPLPTSNRSSPSPTRGLGDGKKEITAHRLPGKAGVEQLVLGHGMSDAGALSDGNGSDSGNEATLFGVDEKNPLLGVVFIDIVSSSDLPYDKNLTRTSFDMDPFVVITHGRQTFKTRFLRHTLNPTWNERLYFHVRQSYLRHLVKFSVYDHDKFSNNDFIGSFTMTVQELLDLRGQNTGGSAIAMEEKVVPLTLAKDKWKESFKSTLTIRACFKTAEELRKAFWLALVKQHDSDDNGSMNHLEILAMLDYLQAISPEKLVDQFFKECGKSPSTDELTFQELITVLEQYVKEENSIGTSESGGSKASSSQHSSVSPTCSSTSPRSSDSEGEMDIERHKIIYIDTCPICHKANLSMLGDTDIITHVAICTMEDPAVRVDRLMLGDFVTEAYAQRKWFTRAVNRLGYGRFSVGRNNANIIVQDRATGQLIEEKIPVYIRLGIRLLYKNIASKSAVDTRAIRRLLKSTSLKQGKKFDDPSSIRDIRPFIQFHDINVDEILDPIDSFKNFNEFFYRKIKPDSRELASPNDPRVAVSPADCRCTCFPTINEATRLWIKGEGFSIARLLGNTPEDQALAQIFNEGSLAIFRLAPQDYHRFHFPVDGQIRPHKAIDGQYFTVNPMAIRSGLDVYGENKRCVSIIETEQFGLVAYVSIGAMMVGSIVLTCEPGHRYSRMDEFGYFAFGGSTIVLLFQKGMMKFDDDLVENSQRSLETLIRMGSSIGTRPDAL